MAFKKGKSGNPEGRKKGTPNKTTKELRQMIHEVIHTNFSRTKIARDLKQLSPKYRLEFYFKLLEYTLPKPISTIIEDEKPSQSDFFQNIIKQMTIHGHKPIDYSKLDNAEDIKNTEENNSQI